MARSVPFPAFGLLSLAAVAVGLWSLRYALPGMPGAAPLDNLDTDRLAFLAHAVSASIALLLGPLQFVGALRRHRPEVHRAVGWMSVAAISVAWAASVPMAMHAQTGPLASAGFLAAGTVWIVTAALGVVRAREHDFAAHRRWMVRCFALTAAAVTLRVQLGLSGAAGLPFELAYPVIAWSSWVPNLVVAEWLLRRTTPVSR